MKRAFLHCFALGLLLLAPGVARAQWQTQSIDLKPGWNAVFLHVDASHATLLDLVGSDASNPIQEIWLWNPAPATMQFVNSPQLPTGTGSQWSSWDRFLGGSSALQKLVGNAAYLVRVGTNVSSYTWNLKGRPVPPKYLWTSTGLNFLGFSTLASPAPFFDKFLAPAPGLQSSGEFYQYVGGPLNENNPQRVFAYRTTPVTRGQAFWVRAGDTFNRYFGPFEAVLQNDDGVHFRDTLGQYRIRLRNITSAPLTVGLELLASETAPAAQTPVVATPPVLLRGPINTTNLTFGYTNLSAGKKTWTLAKQGDPGADVEVILGINRYAMSGSAGSLYAGILRLTDSLNLSQIDLPVSATVSSKGGLWIGEASVSQVRNYLKNYERDANNSPVVSSNGQYAVASVNTNLGPVAQAYPLRLIVHSDTTNTVLLQRVFYGLRYASNIVVATKESLLDAATLDNSRRISTPHLPFRTNNVPWSFNGTFTQGGTLTALVNLDYNDHASNPFVHTYHPDHDNVNATFAQVLPQGSESWSINREITLSITPPTDDFSSLTGSGQTLNGVYDESITFSGGPGDSRRFDVRGVFSINRISDVSVLTQF